MNQLAEFQRETKHLFLSGKVISVWSFYAQLDTTTLERLIIGFERDYDASQAGDLQRPPMRWLSERLGIINFILEHREATHPRTATEKMWAHVEKGLATRILKFNQPR